MSRHELSTAEYIEEINKARRHAAALGGWGMPKSQVETLEKIDALFEQLTEQVLSEGEQA